MLTECPQLNIKVCQTTITVSEKKIHNANTFLLYLKELQSRFYALFGFDLYFVQYEFI